VPLIVYLHCHDIIITCTSVRLYCVAYLKMLISTVCKSAIAYFNGVWRCSIKDYLLTYLLTCPNQFSLRSAILSTSVVSWHRIPRTASFLILSRLVNINNLLSHVISAVRIRLSSSFLEHQHSEPYTAVLELRRFHTASLESYWNCWLTSIVCWMYSPLHDFRLTHRLRYTNTVIHLLH